jgi:tellurite methyltransferase
MAEDARREGEADSTQEAPASEWADYYDAVGDSPPRTTLLEALARFDVEDAAPARRAVDLGCGNGRDTVELLRRGWHVLAIDSDAEGLRRLRARIAPDQAARLQTSRAPVEAAAWPEVDLVNASYVLPLCSAAAFLTADRHVSPRRRSARRAALR